MIVYIFHVRDSKILSSAHGIILSLGLRKKRFCPRGKKMISSYSIIADFIVGILAIYKIIELIFLKLD
jgi:hypothetical protein